MSFYRFRIAPAYRILLNKNANNAKTLPRYIFFT